MDLGVTLHNSMRFKNFAICSQLPFDAQPHRGTVFNRQRFAV